MPGPMIEATRSGSNPAPANPACSAASSAAMSAKRVKRSFPLTSPSCASRGTSPAILQLSAAVSIDSMRRTPLRPARSASTAARLPRPKGEMMPMPVMATRGITNAECRMLARLILHSAFCILHSPHKFIDDVNHIAECFHSARFVVRNRNVKLLLDGKENRERVERVDTGFGERSGRAQRLLGDVALLLANDLDELPLDLLA